MVASANFYRETGTPGLYEIDTPAGLALVPASEDDLKGSGRTLALPDPEASLLAPGSRALANNAHGPGPISDDDRRLIGDWAKNAETQELLSQFEEMARKTSGNNAHGAPPPAPGAAPLSIDQLDRVGEKAPSAAPKKPTPKSLAPLQAGMSGGGKPKPKSLTEIGVDGKPIAPVLSKDQEKEGAEWDAERNRENALGPSAAEVIEEGAADANIDRGVEAGRLLDERIARGEQQSAELGRQIRREQLAQKEQERRNAEMAHEYQQRQMDIDRGREEIRENKIVPDKFWKDMPGWAEALSIMAVIAGGALAGKNGGENEALRFMNGLVERNVQAQKDERDQRIAGLHDQENDLDRLVKIYGSPQLAEEELRQRSRELLQKYGEKQLLDQGAVDAAQQYKMALAEWDVDRKNAQAALANGLAQGVQDEYLRGMVSEKTPYAAALPQEEVVKIAVELAKQGIKPKGTAGLAAIQKDVHQLATEWSSNKLTELDQAIGAYEDLLAIVPEGDLPTFASRNIVSRGIRTVADKIGGEGSGSKLLDSDEEVRATEKLERQLNEAKSKELGASRSDSELADFSRGQATIRTREGLAERVRELKRERQTRAAAVRGGHAPEVVQAYEQAKSGYAVRRAPGSLRAAQ